MNEGDYRWPPEPGERWWHVPMQAWVVIDDFDPGYDAACLDEVPCIRESDAQRCVVKLRSLEPGATPRPVTHTVILQNVGDSVRAETIVNDYSVPLTESAPEAIRWRLQLHTTAPEPPPAGAGGYSRVAVTNPGTDPDSPLRTVSFPPPGETTYTHAVIGGETEVGLHRDGTGDIYHTGLVINPDEEST